MFRNIGAWISSLRTDPLGTLVEIVFMIVALLLSLILHELGHGFVALKCGDPTAKMMGRLSLDPRKHLDPIGAICMFFLGIGWAKPVPVNPYNFRHRDRDMILVSVAGICVNLVLFLITLFLDAITLKLIGIPAEYVQRVLSGRSYFTGYGIFVEYLQVFLTLMYSFNISLAVFNLVPVPPLDGFRLVNQIFFKGQLSLEPRIMQMIHFGFLFVCLSGVLSTAFSRVCNFCVSGAARLFINLLY